MIYLIENHEKNIKIGVAKDVFKRLKELQTGNAYELRLKYTLKVPNDYQFEKHMHEVCERYHLHGEWFSPKVLPFLKRIPWYQDNLKPYRKPINDGSCNKYNN